MAWAQFDDKGNIIAGPQSGRPGSTLVDPEYWAEVYSGWRQVPDNLTPPPPVQTREGQIAALNAEYEPQRRQLLDYLHVAVNVKQDTTLAGELRTEYAALEAEYKKRLEAIK